MYYHLELERLRELYRAGGAALHPALGSSTAAEPASSPARVLFLCTHNSARSQMAEALLRDAGQGHVQAFSAGSEVRDVHALAIQVMQERRLDIRAQHSKHLNEYRGQHFDLVITVCDRVREGCPSFPGRPETRHWSLPDPAAVSGAKRQLAAFRQTADELASRIQFLLFALPTITSNPKENP